MFFLADMRPHHQAWRHRPFTMGDNHGGVAATAVSTFPVTLCVLLILYLALVMVSFADLLDVCACLHVVKLTSAYVMLTSVIILTQKLLKILTIQIPYMIRKFSSAGFAAMLKPSPFTGAHFKRWQNKTLLWLTTMGVQGIADGTPIGSLTSDEEKAFRVATVLFVGVILNVLGDNLVDAYLHTRDGKERWDVFEAKLGAADAGGELYAMEHFNDYKMVENRSVVE
jgi:hypothetical protein